MPNVRSSQRVIREMRSGRNESANYQCIADINIPAHILELFGENILVGTAGEGNQKSFIFSRNDLVEIFSNSSNIQADGTFKVVPHLFCQLYTIYCDFHGLVTPVFYILMPNKERATYELVLRKILTIVPDVNIQRLTMDFELGAMNAFISVFGEINIQGCFFHFSQVI